MTAHAHSGWQSVSLREKRLLLRNVEVLPDQVLETFLQPNQNVEQMEQAVGKLDEQSPVYRAMVERSKSLSEDQRKVIDSNCERLRKETLMKAETLQKISLLQRDIKASRQTAPVAPVPAAEPNALERSWAWTKEKANAGWEWTKDKTEKTWEWSKENPTAALAIGATATLGIYSLYRLWKWWKGEPKQEKKAETSEKKSSGWFWKVMLGVPVVGILGWGVYEGVKWMKNSKLFQIQSIAEMKTWVKDQWDRNVKGLKGHGKEVAASVLGLERGKSYELSPEDFHEAERSYRESNGKGARSLSIIRQIFKLKEDESSPAYERFMKAMHEKYDTIPENGIQYARTDAAILNYEDQVGAALQAFGRWISDNEAKFGLIGLAAWATGLLEIRQIIQGVRYGALSVAKTVEKVSETVVRCGLSSLNHPFLSILGFSAALLAERGAIMESKRTYIPENFNELAKALSPAKGIRLFFGDQNPTIDKFAALAKKNAEHLRQITSDFSSWVGTALEKFTHEIIPEIVQSVGRTPEMNNRVRNTASLDNLRSFLEGQKSEESKSAKKREQLLPEKYDRALRQLAEFRDSFLEKRCEDEMTASTEPQEALTALQKVFTDIDIGITVDVHDGLVWWKKPDGSEVNLCVEPSVTDPARFHELSNRLREGEEGYGEYLFFRVVQGMRENAARAGERRFLPEGTACAMVMGNLVYWAEPGNLQDFFVAPVSLVKDLFTDKTWAEYGGDVAKATVHAGIMVGTAAIAVDAASRIKSAAIGGKNPFALGSKGGIIRRSWQVACGVNPFTAPLKVVRDAAGGVLDINIFNNLSSGLSGRDANKLLARSNLRPQWIGIIEDPLSTERELRRTAFLMGEADLESLHGAALRSELSLRVEKKMENIYKFSGDVLQKQHIGNVKGFIKAIGEWYQAQGKVSKFVLVENAARFTLDLPRMGWTKIVHSVIPPPAIAAERQMGKLMRGNVWTEALAKGGGAGLGDVEAILQKAQAGKIIELDGKTLSLIRQSGKAKEIIAGAAQTGDVAEVARALKAAKLAAGLRAVGNMTGFAGDSFGVLMAYCDWQDHAKQIAETKNPALQDLHRTMQNITLTEGGVSAAGVVIQGCVFIKALAAGEGILAAAGTTAASVIVLPVVAAGLAATFVGRPIANRFYEVAKDWTKEEQDWLKHHQGDLLRKLGGVGPGEHGYWQRRAAGSSLLTGTGRWLAQPVTGSNSYQEWKERDYQSTEASNDTERYRVTRAFFMKMSLLPQFSGESDFQYAQRLNTHVMYASRFIDQISGHTFSRQFSSVYEQAERYAELRLLSEKLVAQGGHQFLFMQKGDASSGETQRTEFDLAQFQNLIQEAAQSKAPSPLAFRGKSGMSIMDVVHAYDRQQRSDKMQYLQTVQQLNEKSAESVHAQYQRLLLVSLRYDLAQIESKILDANLAGWEWTGGEDKTRDCLRMVIQNHLLGLLRQEADRVTAAPGLLTSKEFEQSLSVLRGYLQQDAEEFEAEYREQGSTIDRKTKQLRITFSRKNQTTQELLSLPWLSSHIDDTAKHSEGKSDTDIPGTPAA